MKSIYNNVAMKIHISEQTRDAIVNVDNTFMIKDRGEVSLKVNMFFIYLLT